MFFWVLYARIPIFIRGKPRDIGKAAAAAYISATAECGARHLKVNMHNVITTVADVIKNAGGRDEDITLATAAAAQVVAESELASRAQVRNMILKSFRDSRSAQLMSQRYMRRGQPWGVCMEQRMYKLLVGWTGFWLNIPAVPFMILPTLTSL